MPNFRMARATIARLDQLAAAGQIIPNQPYHVLPADPQSPQPNENVIALGIDANTYRFAEGPPGADGADGADGQDGAAGAPGVDGQ